MPTLRITVDQPPAEFAPYEHIRLLLQTPAGFAAPTRSSATEIVFDVPFELKTDRSGVPQPTGPCVQRQNDGRRFVYLSWCGTEGATTKMFRRLKVFFDKVPTFPGAADEYETRVKGTDKKGGPACATAEVLSA